MGICSYCIYKGDPKSSSNRDTHDCHCSPYPKKQFHYNDSNLDFYCNNEDNMEVDYVTGVYTKGSCRDKNSFGECLLFDNGSVPLYAWKNSTILYTLSETPATGDDVYNDAFEKTDVITSVNTTHYYAWTSEEMVVFTLNESPLIDYNVLDSNGNIVGSITEITETGFKIDEEEFTRLESDDFSINTITVNAETYTRDKEDDTNGIIPENDSSEDITDEPVEENPDITDDTPPDPTEDTSDEIENPEITP